AVRFGAVSDLEIEVDAAFGLVHAGPAAGAGILTLLDAPGAGRTADRGIAFVEQRMLRQAEALERILHHVRRPVGERIDLDLALGRRLEQRDARPCVALIPLASGDPG